LLLSEMERGDAIRRPLNAMQNHGLLPDAELLVSLVKSKNSDIRAHAVYLLGINGYKEGEPALIKALNDEDKLVQRRACEALIHAKPQAASCQEIATRSLAMFPQKDKMVNRELAVLLTHFRKEKIIDKPVHAALLKDLQANPEDKQQQIHYFYCLRLLHEGWT